MKRKACGEGGKKKDTEKTRKLEMPETHEECPTSNKKNGIILVAFEVWKKFSGPPGLSNEISKKKMMMRKTCIR